jgi:hypothetical protein
MEPAAKRYAIRRDCNQIPNNPHASALLNPSRNAKTHRSKQTRTHIIPVRLPKPSQATRRNTACQIASGARKGRDQAESPSNFSWKKTSAVTAEAKVRTSTTATARDATPRIAIPATETSRSFLSRSEPLLLLYQPGDEARNVTGVRAA